MDKVTLGEALSFLSPLIGAGGLTAIIVALLGYFKGRKPAEQPTTTLAMGALYADRVALDQLAEAFNRNTAAEHRGADSHDRLASAVNNLCDEMARVRRRER